MLRFNSKQALLFGLLVLAASACTQKKSDTSAPFNPEVVLDELSSAPLKNCKFVNPAPIYAFQSAIAPNSIICEEGIPTKVELLTDSPLPTGIRFDNAQLAIVGNANEKVSKAPYQFYLKNEAGYMVVTLNITIQ